MDNEDQMPVDGQSFFQRWGLLMLIGAGVFLISYIFIGRKNNPATSTSSPFSSLPGVSTQNGSNGQPLVEYVPTTGDQYTNIDTNTYNTTNTTNNGPQIPVDFWRPVPPTPPQPTPPPTYLGPPVQAPPPPVVAPPHTYSPPPSPPANSGPNYSTYIVRSGDVLSSIASRYGMTWQSLYNLNQSVIDSWAAQHGNPIPGGPWNNIFPNEPLQVPA